MAEFMFRSLQGAIQAWAGDIFLLFFLFGFLLVSHFLWNQGQGAFSAVELGKLIPCLFVREQRVTDTDSLAVR